MELHQVQYFLAACEALNFTRAAEQCNVSQPALTTAIKKLEEELGGPLFHRERNRVLLSELGQITRPHFEQLLGQANAARSAADNFRRLHQAPLNVGVLVTIGPMLLARFLARFRSDYPGIEIEVHEGRPDDLAKRLEDGAVDLAVLSQADALDPMFRSTPLYRERYLVVFPAGHPFEAMDTIRLGDVSGKAYVDRLACEMRDMVMAACAAEDVELYATFRSEREDWIQGMVVAGMGFAFLPEYSITAAGMLSRPLVEPPVEREVAIVCVAGRRLTPAAAAFVGEARRHHWSPAR